MSSRQDRKQRLRQERLEREQAAARQTATRRRLQLVAGAILGVAAIAAVVAAVVASGGNGGGGSGPEGAGDTANVPIPARRIADFDAAVKAAGCEFKAYASEGRDHLPSDSATNDKYKTNPPTSGLHGPAPAEDGVYAADNPPTKESAVHSLEHGRINIEYAPDMTKRAQDQLQTLANEKLKGVEGYHQLLFPNTTDMPYEVAAVAWTKSLGCTKMNDKTFDAIRAFRERFVDKGPELIP